MDLIKLINSHCIELLFVMYLFYLKYFACSENCELSPPFLSTPTYKIMLYHFICYSSAATEREREVLGGAVGFKLMLSRVSELLYMREVKKCEGIRRKRIWFYSCFGLFFFYLFFFVWILNEKIRIMQAIQGEGFFILL